MVKRGTLTLLYAVRGNQNLDLQLSPLNTWQPSAAATHSMIHLKRARMIHSYKPAS